MAVVLAVSASAIICIDAFSKISARMVSRNEAVTTAENALEGFKFANSLPEFDSLVGTLSNRIIERDSFTNPSPGGDNIGRAAYTFQNTYYSVSIYVVYNYDARTATCSISVLDTEHGLFIFSVNNYTKAVVNYGS